MKLTHVFGALVLVAGLGGCKKKEETKAEPQAAASGEAPKTADKPAAKGGRKIPNSPGFTAEVPARWQDNGIGGAAGMHLDGDGGLFQVREISAEEAGRSFADWKKDSEEMLFQKWISAEELPDGGFKALYEIDKIKMQGEEPVKDGTQFAFHVRKKLAGKLNDCYGVAAKKEDAEEALAICQTVQAN